MELVKVSSKGQLVVPKRIREAVGIETGTVMRVSHRGRRIILEPVAVSMIERLHGKFSKTDLLKDLEAEHSREIRRQNRS